MAIINVTLPSDGTTASVANYNVPINTILAGINGNLDDNNIASLSGTKITAGTLPDTAASATAKQGWITGSAVPTATVFNGNRSYTHTYASSVAGFKSPGMRNKYVRSTASPTQTALLNGTTQYFNRTATINGMTFTNNFASGAWVKMSNYVASGQVAIVASRSDGASGWELWIDSAGYLLLNGRNGAASNYSRVTSYQALPLNRWVHITAQLDMLSFTATPTTSYTMIDGVDVAATVARAGTNPTALVQAGNLVIGGEGAGTFLFPGKISQAFITSAKITQTQARAIYSQGLIAGDVATYNIVSAFSLSGASGLTDINTTNANNLTANGSAVTTTADSFTGQNASSVPSGTTDYSITQFISADGLTEVVQVPEGCTIPTNSSGITSIAYALGNAYGFPSDEDKWYLLVRLNTSITSQNLTASVWSIFLAGATLGINIPIGAWVYGYMGGVQFNAGAVASISGHMALTSAAPTNGTYNERVLTWGYNSGTQFLGVHMTAQGDVSLTAATQYNLYIAYDQGSGAVYVQLRGDLGSFTIFAKNAWL